MKISKGKIYSRKIDQKHCKVLEICESNSQGHQVHFDIDGEKFTVNSIWFERQWEPVFIGFLKHPLNYLISKTRDWLCP